MSIERIRANGIQMRYLVEGAPSGQIMLFCNGLATNMSMWDPQIAHFSGRYRIVRYDLRGHGESDSTQPPYTLSLLVEDLRSFLDALGFEQVHLVSESLGGMIAQAFAVRYPRRLMSLTLCDTSARIKRELWEGRIQQVLQEGIEPMVEPSLERWFTKPYRDANPDVTDGVRAMIRTTTSDGYVGGAGVVREMNHVEQLSRISTPTLIVVGRQDVSTPVAEAQLMHSHIVGSRLSIIEDAAHLPNIEKAQEFNRILEDFLLVQEASMGSPR